MEGMTRRQLTQVKTLGRDAWATNLGGGGEGGGGLWVTGWKSRHTLKLRHNFNGKGSNRGIKSGKAAGDAWPDGIRKEFAQGWGTNLGGGGEGGGGLWVAGWKVRQTLKIETQFRR